MCHLSPREKQVVALVLEELSHKEMAAIMMCAPRTVEVYVTRIAGRLPPGYPGGTRGIRKYFRGKV